MILILISSSSFYASIQAAAPAALLPSRKPEPKIPKPRQKTQATTSRPWQAHWQQCSGCGDAARARSAPLPIVQISSSQAAFGADLMGRPIQFTGTLPSPWGVAVEWMHTHLTRDLSSVLVNTQGWESLDSWFDSDRSRLVPQVIIFCQYHPLDIQIHLQNIWSQFWKCWLVTLHEFGKNQYSVRLYHLYRVRFLGRRCN